MVKMSLNLVHDDLTQDELKLCLISLDALNNLINDCTLQDVLIDYFKRVENFYGFNSTSESMFDNLYQHQDLSIELISKKLFVKYTKLNAAVCAH